MKYFMRVVGKPVLYRHQKNNQTHAYTAEKLHKYRGRFPRRNVRPSSLTKSLESHYIPRVKSNLLYKKAQKTAWKNSYLFPKAEAHVFYERMHGENLSDLEKYSCKLPTIFADNWGMVGMEKSQNIEFELIELETDGNHYGFLIIETTTNRIVKWEDLPDADIVQEYLRTHLFPEDRHYSEKDFLNDIKKVQGYIYLSVEKQETAKFICKLCCELFSQC